MNPALAGLSVPMGDPFKPVFATQLRREYDENLAELRGSFSIRAIGSLAHNHSS